MARRLLPALISLAALFSGTPAFAQFTADGVIHDSTTLAPLSGVAVFIIDPATERLLSPGDLIDPAAQGRVTGADGRYIFGVRGERSVRIQLDRPSETFAFPSLKKPPLNGEYCSEIACSGATIANEAQPVERSPYVLRMFTAVRARAGNNHIPIDSLASLIETKIFVDKARARIGDHLGVTIEVSGTVPEPILDADVAVVLPPELRFLPKTLRAVRTDRDGRTDETAVTAAQDGLVLRIPSPSFANTELQRWRFLVRVAAKKHDNRLELRAQYERGGGIAISTEGRAIVSLDDDPVLEESTILGSVFCEDDEGRKGWRDAVEEGLFGARVYLDNGHSAASDLDGLFHFTQVKAGMHLVKLDEGSLPPGSVPLGPTRVQLHLTPGTPAKVRFPVRCELDVLEDPVRVTRGAEQAALDPPPEIERTIELAYDFELGTFVLGGRSDEMTTLYLDGAQLGADARKIRFYPNLAPSYTPTRWLIRVEETDAAGKILRAVKEPLTGRGLPPPFVDLLVERPGIYRAQLEVEAGDYDRGSSDPIFVVTTTASTERVATKTFLARTQEPEAKQVLAGRPIGEKLLFEGHWDDTPDADEQSRALAEKIRNLAVKNGFSADLIEVTGRGAIDPLVPAISPRARKQNRRVEIYRFSDEERPARRPRAPQLAENAPSFTVTVDGVAAELPIPESGRGTYTLDLDTPAQLELTYVGPRGGKSTVRRVVTPARVVRPIDRAPVVPVIDVANGRMRFGALELPLPVFAAQMKKLRAENDRLTVEMSTADVVSSYRLTLELLDGTVVAEAAGTGAPPAALALSSTVASDRPTRLRFVAANEDGAHFQQKVVELPPLAQGVNMELPVVALAPRVRAGQTDLAEGTVSPSERVLAVGDGDLVLVPMVDLAELGEAKEPAVEETTDVRNAPAAEALVFLPRAGQELTRLEAPVRGETRPENKITINDQPVVVHADGRFSALVPLEPGNNRLVIESEDELGNRARFERAVTTSSSAYFLMAMGDVVLSGANADLPGSNEHTRLDLGSVALDGRAVAFGKARFLAPGPFQRITLLGHFDTAELGRPEILRQLDDPLRLLPAFGDASLEQQEIPGHRALYLELEADRSRVIVGSAVTTLAPFGDDSLFSFRRAGFGVHANIAKSFGEHDDTEIRGTFMFGEDGVLRGHDELQGTGGALFWLSNPEIVEGSETVRLVIRDRDTGMVLSSEELARDTDYEFRPREGRLMMRTPVPSVAGGAFLSMNRSATLSGHPIYLVVDYAYQKSGFEQNSYGIELRETLADQLELYGALAGEDTGASDYRLYGVGLAWRPTVISSIELEWARSTGSTNLGALSTDGGLSFRSLAPVDPQNYGGKTPFPGADGNDAFSIKGTLGFGDLTERTVDPGFVRGYFGVAGNQLSAPTSAREAGRLWAGAAARYAISDEFAVRAGFDTSISTLPTVPTLDVHATWLQRSLATAGADYKSGDNAVAVEVAYLDTATDDVDGSMGGANVRYQRRLNEELSVFVSQDVVAGDDPYLSEGTAGRLATTAGVSWAVSEALTLSLAEMVRWNGENATQLGAKVRVDDNFSTYIAERISDGFGDTRMTTVIGAEDLVAEGSRTYAEYQIDGAHPAISRAVLGMDNRWRLTEGLEFSLTYERAQRADRLYAQEPRFSGSMGGVAATLNGYAEFEPSDSLARDAFSIGLSFTRLDRLKLASRVELRRESGSKEGPAREFFVLGTHHGAALSVNRDISLLGRFTFQEARDTDLDRTHAKLMEWSMGGALRPRAEDWFTLLLRYTRQLIQRPRDSTRLVLFEEETRDALAIEPIIDTPWNVQLVEKVALIAMRARQDESTEVSGLDALWINRLNARVLEQFEAGLEYRMLADLTLNTVERGFLIEAGWVPDERVRVGLGYNFTSFSDDELTATNRDAGGPFLRVTGRY